MAVAAPVVVEPMRLADVPAVHEIERLSFTSPWPDYAFEQELTSNRLARYIVARAASRSGSRVVGFAGLWLMVDEAHVTTFGVHPEWRRRGVGRQMLVTLFDLAWELRAARMTLEVRASNRGAQALYAELGFAIAGRRIAYYTDDGEDALVMTTPDLASIGVQQLVDAARRRIAQGPR